MLSEEVILFESNVKYLEYRPVDKRVRNNDFWLFGPVSEIKTKIMVPSGGINVLPIETAHSLKSARGCLSMPTEIGPLFDQ